MSDSPSTGTRDRILTVAQSLFAKHGYAGVSLRQITAAAGVNVAAVNYHFYDRERLYVQIIHEGLAQVNHERLRLLEAALAKAEDRPVPLEEIFDALARPLLMPSTEKGATTSRLIGRLLLERQPFLEELLLREFQPTMTRFGQALRRHRPALPAGDFVWRVTFVTGALHHTLVTLPDMALHTRGLCQGGDCAGALRNFTIFAVNAFSA